MASNSSSIDLALCSPSLSTMVEWTVLDIYIGVTIFPTLVHFNIPNLDGIHPPRWLFHRADWDTFSEKIIMPDHFSNNIDTLVGPNHRRPSFAQPPLQSRSLRVGHDASLCLGGMLTVPPRCVTESKHSRGSIGSPPHQT